MNWAQVLYRRLQRKHATTRHARMKHVAWAQISEAGKMVAVSIGGDKPTGQRWAKMYVRVKR